MFFFLSFLLSWDIFFPSFFLGVETQGRKKRKKNPRKEKKTLSQLLVREKKKKLKLGMKMGKKLKRIPKKYGFLRDSFELIPQLAPHAC